jgi:methionine sulfoxide reductase heme-binding subunit
LKTIAALRDWQPTDTAKAVVLAAACAPLTLLLFDAASDGLGANPVEAVLHRTGDWALRLLLVTLAITPLRRWTGWQWLLRFRRLLGLVAFGYALLHGLTYVVLDRGLLWDEIVADVLERPYFTVGLTALLLMVPLAATSTRAMMRRLGRRWQQLHRLVYAAGVLAVLHFLWASKLDRVEPLVYAGILAVLLLSRVPGALRVRRHAAVRGPCSSPP